MTVMLDTSIIVDHLRGDERAVRLLTELFERGTSVGSDAYPHRDPRWHPAA